ncbi:MAG: type II toxin-antitoxin system death-on-curing family toxin [Fimbriimonadaceae bacterium]|nr:type II toxin-antitoxin system death-on-curing family toxin [Fimbriimonadaceae bacterium]
MTEHLTLVEVLAIHADQIERFGGAPSVRDLGLVEAALFRPQSGYYSDVIQQAAALWESLAQNHAFVDGNKRVAFASTDVFLRLNGVSVTATPEQAYAFISILYRDGRFVFEELERWLRDNTRSVR